MPENHVTQRSCIEIFKGFVKDTFAIIIGGIIFAAGLCIFASPNEILTGGASGVAIILNSLIGLPLGTGIFIVNIPLIIASFIVCKARYTIKTMYAIMLFSAVIDLFELFVPVRFEQDYLLSAIYGGILTGIGLFVVMSRSIVTGGSDLLAYIIQRRHPGKTMGSLLLIIDGVVVAAGAIIFKSLETALYSMALIIILTLTLNNFLRGRVQGVVQFIFSDKSEEIKKCIDTEIQRGCTVLLARSGYRNLPIDVVMCAVNLRESVILRQRVFEIDEKAFIIIANADRVCGNGFIRPNKEDIF